MLLEEPKLKDQALPLRLNQSGMVPIIFAISVVTFPALVAQFLSTA